MQASDKRLLRRVAKFEGQLVDVLLTEQAICLLKEDSDLGFQLWWDPIIAKFRCGERYPSAPWVTTLRVAGTPTWTVREEGSCNAEASVVLGELRVGAPQDAARVVRLMKDISPGWSQLRSGDSPLIRQLEDNGYLVEQDEQGIALFHKHSGVEALVQLDVDEAMIGVQLLRGASQCDQEGYVDDGIINHRCLAASTVRCALAALDAVVAREVDRRTLSKVEITTLVEQMEKGDQEAMRLMERAADRKLDMDLWWEAGAPGALLSLLDRTPQTPELGSRCVHLLHQMLLIRAHEARYQEVVRAAFDSLPPKLLPQFCELPRVARVARRLGLISQALMADQDKASQEEGPKQNGSLGHPCQPVDVGVQHDTQMPRDLDQLGEAKEQLVDAEQAAGVGSPRSRAGMSPKGSPGRFSLIDGHHHVPGSFFWFCDCPVCSAVADQHMDLMQGKPRKRAPPEMAEVVQP